MENFNSAHSDRFDKFQTRDLPPRFEYFRVTCPPLPTTKHVNATRSNFVLSLAAPRHLVPLARHLVPALPPLIRHLVHPDGLICVFMENPIWSEAIINVDINPAVEQHLYSNRSFGIFVGTVIAVITIFSVSFHITNTRGGFCFGNCYSEELASGFAGDKRKIISNVWLFVIFACLFVVLREMNKVAPEGSRGVVGSFF
jgi:hypothetical protein